MSFLFVCALVWCVCFLVCLVTRGVIDTDTLVHEHTKALFKYKSQHFTGTFALLLFCGLVQFIAVVVLIVAAFKGG